MPIMGVVKLLLLCVCVWVCVNRHIYIACAIRVNNNSIYLTLKWIYDIFTCKVWFLFYVGTFCSSHTFSLCRGEKHKIDRLEKWNTQEEYVCIRKWRTTSTIWILQRRLTDAYKVGGGCFIYIRLSACPIKCTILSSALLIDVKILFKKITLFHDKIHWTKWKLCSKNSENNNIINKNASIQAYKRSSNSGYFPLDPLKVVFLVLWSFNWTRIRISSFFFIKLLIAHSLTPKFLPMLRREGGDGCSTISKICSLCSSFKRGPTPRLWVEFISVIRLMNEFHIDSIMS